MTANAKRLLAAYVGVAVLTLIFQIYVRAPQCAGVTGCAVSFIKGCIWSVIWPAGWIVYLRGLF
jgi:hypothetical protein